jgi:diaminopimelate epimerase
LYCFHQGYIQSNCSFITNDAIHQGQILEDENIKISINSPVLVDRLPNGDFEVNTGSPHYVQIANSLDNIDFKKHCKLIRNNDKYFKNGINVNLVKIEDNFLDMRTYERGVEDETLSCGSGVTATALAIAFANKIDNSLSVKTRGGNLKVEFNRTENSFDKVFLSGPAKFVFSGDYDL